MTTAHDFTFTQLNGAAPVALKEYAGKVRVVYMNLVVHPDTAQLAHVYSCAAAKQGKYLAWKDAFWTKGFNVYAQSGGKERAAMGEENILKLSGEAGLDVQKLKTDASSEECKKRLEEDGVELRKFKRGLGLSQEEVRKLKATARSVMAQLHIVQSAAPSR